MIEWLQANWLTILGTIILIVTGFYVPGVRGLWMTGLKALLSERVLIKLFLAVAEKIVKSTKNTLDDEWLEELKTKIGK